ncbi:MAG: ABC transporter permease [Phycisphaerae bacterium]|nr:ABC transporter permease [Phycisphaerae bacterium]
MSTDATPDLSDLWRPVPLRTGLFWSLYGVWYRHVRVYCKSLYANATPPVLEPLFFFTAIGIGLGHYLAAETFDGLPYKTYVASGLLVASAMFTAVFETTFGTFVRLVYQKTYDAMLGTHLRIHEMFIGEMIFSASKGAVFSAVVLLITILFGARPTWWCLLVPVIGFLTAYLFAAIGLIVTSYVKTITNYSFFTSGVITPLFFFSGTFFPIRGHHWVLDLVSFLVPLTHPIELSRALFKSEFTGMTLLHLAMLVAYLVICHIAALRRMTKRVLLE